MKNNFPNTPVVQLEWSHDGNLNFLEACTRLGFSDELERLQSDLAALAALTKAMAPVVGFIGTLKAGKTSTVKKFLSENGRRRTPSGLGKKLGTQRFVFWLPATWKSKTEVWQAFRDGLEALFGNQLEELSQDPEISIQQYNGYGDVATHIGIPLFAFDEGLDDFGFALMDSPDMERPVAGVERERSAEIRIEFVQRAMRGLSAVLVICEVSKNEMALINELLKPSAPDKSAPVSKDVPVFLLLNQADCADGVLTRLLSDEGTRDLVNDLSATRIYAAYHGLYHGAREAISKILGTDDFDATIPQFFRVEPPQQEGEASVLLENELAALEPAKLWQEKIEAKRAALHHDLTSCITGIGAKLIEQRTELEKIRNEVVRFVREQVVDTELNKLAIPLMPSTAAQIANAIKENSPFYAKPTMFFHGKIMAGFEYLKNLKDGIKAVQDPSDVIREKAGEFRKEITKRNIPNFNPTQWASRSRNQKFMPDEVPENTLVKLWTQVGSKANDLKVDLDSDVLRKFANFLWDEVPWWKKLSLALLGPIILVGALAALVMAMLDGGATSVVLFFSLNELMLCLGLGSMVTPAFMIAAKSLDEDLINRAAIPFYTVLVKGALDSFGLPRHGIGQVKEQFSNTGAFTLDLTPVTGEDPLKTLVDLSEGRLLGRLVHDAEATIRNGISVLNSPTPSA